MWVRNFSRVQCGWLVPVPCYLGPQLENSEARGSFTTHPNVNVDCHLGLGSFPHGPLQVLFQIGPVQAFSSRGSWVQGPVPETETGRDGEGPGGNHLTFYDTAENSLLSRSMSRTQGRASAM